MQNWQLALEDALQCVGKDSNFIKGYFRLSIAQSELGYYDDAETTLRAALAKEPGSCLRKNLDMSFSLQEIIISRDSKAWNILLHG